MIFRAILVLKCFNMLTKGQFIADRGTSWGSAPPVQPFVADVGARPQGTVVGNIFGRQDLIGGVGGLNPRTQTENINVLNLFQPRRPGAADKGAQVGGLFNLDYNQALNFPTDYNIIDWSVIDRRAEDGWWHLYPFGERYFDLDLGSDQGRPWHDRQIDLDFFLPFYGFRFNYTFIFPEGFIAMSYPWYIQPPYTFPSPRWPDDPDPSIIAAYMSPQSFMFIGDQPISHVWYRIVQRPIQLVGQRIISESMSNFVPTPYLHEPIWRLPNGRPSQSSWGRELLKVQEGRVEDPGILDLITEEIRSGMVGARGFVVDYALIVTWERMGYGGAPKSTELHRYEQFRKWQNTYQMVVATDEIRTYCVFNYGNINWTASTSAGALAGRGGKQSAVVGFNGGNGTGFFEMPYSTEGNSYKLVQYGSTQIAGRWMARIDENIEYGGCTNTSTGILRTHVQHATMLGGFSLNVTGPCLRDNDIVKLQMDEYITVDCIRLDMVIARCTIPINTIYRMGMVTVKLSVDGGKEYNYWNKFYILAPARGRRQVNLLNDPIVANNNWRSYLADNLTMTWPPLNLTYDLNTFVDIKLYGYWEDVEKHEFVEIGALARNVPNKGNYNFNPRLLVKDELPNYKPYERYSFGVMQVRVSQNWMESREDGLFWSTVVPFGWYFRDQWEYEYGTNWAFDKCVEWFEWDGKRDNFYQHIEPRMPCPCTLAQAMLDVGRFFPLPDCDMTGDSNCYYTQGAMHCVISAFAIWTGAGQECCYDINGWLLFSQDWEYNVDYLRFYSAGVPQRAHPYGSYPYKRPPYVPTMSNFYNDLMPYDFCCRWAGHCELYYWRRETSGCIAYVAPVAGFAYGEPHFITYDGAKYTFNGKGFFVLSSMKSPRHDLMVQIRMEEPPKTIWDENVLATVITGVAAQDNSSDSVQVYARKEFRDWRYKMDVYVGGVQVFFDTAHQKTQHFYGVTLFNPARNMNTSEIWIMFASGAGVRVMESRGMLDVMVTLPQHFNETSATTDQITHNQPTYIPTGGSCSKFYRTGGLLGTYNGDLRDDFLAPDCTEIPPPFYPPNAQDAQRIYYDFGVKWRVDGTRHRLLFQENIRPIYNPLRFAQTKFQPVFDAWQRPYGNETLILKREEVRVLCQGVPSCEYDYMMTGRREIALNTLIIEKKAEGTKYFGEKRTISCGPLQKNEGVIKYPPGNNYLDGVTVTFACKPEYFLHGTEQRTCLNGTWSPGWHCWCRQRGEENALKWLTGLLVAFLIAAFFVLIFSWCYCLRMQTKLASTPESIILRRSVAKQPPIDISVSPGGGGGGGAKMVASGGSSSVHGSQQYLVFELDKERPIVKVRTLDNQPIQIVNESYASSRAVASQSSASPDDRHSPRETGKATPKVKTKYARRPGHT